MNFKTAFKDIIDVENITTYSFGASENDFTPERILFAGGGNKFSALCGFSFKLLKQDTEKVASTIAPDTELKSFDFEGLKILYCPKMRSKIFRKDPVARHKWFAMGIISKDRWQVLSKEDLKNTTGFDIDLFFQTDFFKKNVEKFKKLITHGLLESKKVAVKHSNVNVAIKTMEEAWEIIGNCAFEDKTYALQDFSVNNVIAKLTDKTKTRTPEQEKIVAKKMEIFMRNQALRDQKHYGANYRRK